MRPDWATLWLREPEPEPELCPHGSRYARNKGALEPRSRPLLDPDTACSVDGLKRIRQKKIFGRKINYSFPKYSFKRIKLFPSNTLISEESSMMSKHTCRASVAQWMRTHVPVNGFNHWPGKTPQATGQLSLCSTSIEPVL